MTERPILMNGAMVRATLSGAKKQTRRIVKPQPPVGHAWAGWCTSSTHRADEGKATWAAGEGAMLRDAHRVACPYGQPGDRLWVRETWRTTSDLDGKPPRDFAGWPVRYEADGAVVPHGSHFGDTSGKTRTSIYMPRWASRILLEIVSVRVERLNDCSEADARAEGFHGPMTGSDWEGINQIGRLPSECYAELWDLINGTGAWAENPFVWCIEFRRVDP